MAGLRAVPGRRLCLNGVENAESTAQVIWGLSVSGTDPVNSPYFKSGKQSMLACLLGLQLSNGGFPHERGGEAEVMATEQALMALGAYQAYVNLDRQVPAAPVYADQTDIASWRCRSYRRRLFTGSWRGRADRYPFSNLNKK